MAAETPDWEEALPSPGVLELGPASDTSTRSGDRAASGVRKSISEGTPGLRAGEDFALPLLLTFRERYELG